FHSSTISRSALRMLLRMLANVFPRQSVSPEISWSIRSDGFMGSLYLQFSSRFQGSSIPGRALRNKSPDDLAFPHPKPRKEQYRKKPIPDAVGVVVSIRRRIINVPEYRNTTEDVNPAKD